MTPKCPLFRGFTIDTHTHTEGSALWGCWLQEYGCQSTPGSVVRHSTLWVPYSPSRVWNNVYVCEYKWRLRVLQMMCTIVYEFSACKNRIFLCFNSFLLWEWRNLVGCDLVHTVLTEHQVGWPLSCVEGITWQSRDDHMSMVPVVGLEIHETESYRGRRAGNVSVDYLWLLCRREALG